MTCSLQVVASRASGLEQNRAMDQQLLRQRSLSGSGQAKCSESVMGISQNSVFYILVMRLRHITPSLRQRSRERGKEKEKNEFSHTALEGRLSDKAKFLLRLQQHIYKQLTGPSHNLDRGNRSS